MRVWSHALFFPAGSAVVPQCSSGGGYVRYPGEEALSPHHCLIHMCTNTTDENQSHVSGHCQTQLISVQNQKIK